MKCWLTTDLFVGARGAQASGSFNLEISIGSRGALYVNSCKR